MLTQAVPDLKDHPFKRFFDFGLRTTLNTDDPGIFNTNMNRECRIAHQTLGLSMEQLETCFQYAAEASFIPRAKREKVWPKPLAN
jgi:aminodeoxyfutalosine deaminase